MDRGFRFFIERRQKHYEVLHENVFKVLSTLEPTISSRTPFGVTLPDFQTNLPVNNFGYEEAKLHMQKEKGDETLDVVIKNYETEIKKINDSYYDKSQEISNNIISEKLNEFQIVSNDLIKEVRDRIDLLLDQMAHANSIDIWVLEMPESKIAGVDSKVTECITAVVKHPRVIELMKIAQGERIRLNGLIHKIQDTSYWISMTIQNQGYDRTADCCPSFYKVLRLRRSK